MHHWHNITHGLGMVQDIPVTFVPSISATCIPFRNVDYHWLILQPNG
jgi:hypothetical protein